MLRIKEILKEKNVTQEELGNRIGVTRSSLIKTINGNPTIETLQKIADALEVSVPELFAPQSGNNFTALIDNDGELRRFDSAEDLRRFLEGI